MGRTRGELARAEPAGAQGGRRNPRGGPWVEAAIHYRRDATISAELKFHRHNANPGSEADREPYLIAVVEMGTSRMD